MPFIPYLQASGNFPGTPTRLNCAPPEVIMTEADAVTDPDSDEDLAGERKDSLDVQDECKKDETTVLPSTE